MIPARAANAILSAAVAGVILLGVANTSLAAANVPTTAAVDLSAAPQLTGRTIEGVKIIGNTQVSTSVIRNLIRTKEGDKLDPETVQADYQRVFGLRKFANVEAKVEPTERGVVVVFVVSEQRQIEAILFRGNVRFTDPELVTVADLTKGQSIDQFRIATAKEAIERLYRDKNYPFAHVVIDDSRLTKSGELVFRIVEGPNVKVRKIAFIGNDSFTADRLKGELQTKSYIWIFRPGTLDLNTVDDDVSAVRRYYEKHGFFDVRVGRKVIWSPDLSQVQITFIVQEGARYTVDRVLFQGNTSVTEADMRTRIRLTEGHVFSDDILQRDVKQVVKAYSPFGYIYLPSSNDPNYLRIEPKTVFKKDVGKVDIVYAIAEGKPFRIKDVQIRGNTKTQDKVVNRELRVYPGQLYNSGELADAVERLRALPLFKDVKITPIGDDPDERTVLVEADDRSRNTASFALGAGVNSNGGLTGNITYEQKNFDITNLPDRPGDLFNGNAFTGAGQTFRATLEPGTRFTTASVRFTDPWIFDQPYSFSGELYLRDRIREDYVDRRIGGRVQVGKRFNPIYSAYLFGRLESVDIIDIQDKPVRAFEILDGEGNHFLTSLGISGTRDTTNRGALPYHGSTTSAQWESVGALGGDYTFQKFTFTHDSYFTIREDLLERKTVLRLGGDIGYIAGDAPFFERFYAGGLGSVRGFAFRGISPRSGPEDDRIGGDFNLSGTAEINYPLYGESLRGVFFADAGTVEDDFGVGTMRASVGTGIRLTLGFFGQVPIAIDFAIPVSKSKEDDTRFISFSLGFFQ